MTLFTMLVVNVYQRGVIKVWYKCSKGLPINVVESVVKVYQKCIVKVYQKM